MSVCKTCGQKLQSRNLTVREREVLKGIASGKSSADIAEELGISVGTINVHRYKIKTKLGAANTPHALMLANAAGIKL
jgi:DNA-binding CsgD family transcriptional regulator